MKKPIDLSKRKQKRKRPNPAGRHGDQHAGDLAITSAVRGANCTLEEKLLIAAMVPTLLKVIRTSSHLVIPPG